MQSLIDNNVNTQVDPALEAVANAQWVAQENDLVQEINQEIMQLERSLKNKFFQQHSGPTRDITQIYHRRVDNKLIEHLNHLFITQISIVQHQPHSSCQHKLEPPHSKLL